MAIQLPYMGGRAVMEILLPNERLVCYATTCGSKGRVARDGRRVGRIRL